jgi:exonuclease III
VISVYSPAWPVDKERLKEIDVSQIKSSSTNPDVWGTDVLWDALRNAAVMGAEWVVGGDFNSSETFDCEWQDTNDRRFGIRSSGNAATLERMRRLGFTECLRRSKEDPIIPTFRHSRGGIEHQIDHLFVSKGLSSRLDKCTVGDQLVIFGKSLSDHLPIIADFKSDDLS